jgi:hypothetical protein
MSTGTLTPGGGQPKLEIREAPYESGNAGITGAFGQAGGGIPEAAMRGLADPVPPRPSFTPGRPLPARTAREELHPSFLPVPGTRTAVVSDGQEVGARYAPPTPGLLERVAAGLRPAPPLPIEVAARAAVDGTGPQPARQPEPVPAAGTLPPDDEGRLKALLADALSAYEGTLLAITEVCGECEPGRFCTRHAWREARAAEAAAARETVGQSGSSLLAVLALLGTPGRTA